MVLVKRPDCRVIVFNYQEREGSNLKKIGLPPIINSRIEITSSVVSANTSKSKSSPSGNFSITLDPTQNWVANISPGSWIVMLLSDEKISDNESLFFQESSLPLIGRVDSVRASRQVDQATGAYQTSYSIVGRDWCSYMESNVYIDQIAAKLPSILAGTPMDSAFGQATRFKLDNKIGELYEKGLPSSSDCADAIFDLWGKQGSVLNIASASESFSERFLPTAPMNIPGQLSLSLKKTSIFLPDLIKRQYGILNAAGTFTAVPLGLSTEATYSRNIEAVGSLDTRRLYGVNTLWQLLQSTVTVGGINEVYGDLSFSNSTPSMTVYKRVRPFSLSSSGFEVLSAISSAAGSGSEELKSSFFNLPKRKIEAEEVVQIEIGTNWSDVVNFIEIIPDTSFFPYLKNIVPATKADNATYSTGSYTISGFKPIIINTNFFPINFGVPDPYGLKDWLPVLKEWYFDTHKMLNGTISLYGRKGYIAVGENILFPASIIADGSFIEGGVVPSIAGITGDQWILAHVESVSHSFTKGQDTHSSSYMTTVTFVRGIITDKEGAGRIARGADGYGVDSKAPRSARKNKNTRGPT